MSTRQAQKEQARAHRLALEHEETARRVRKQRLGALGAVALLAAIGVLVAILASQSHVAKHSAAQRAAAARAGSGSLFAGIPQRGLELGSPNAPVTMEEYADLQCPFCREYALNALPTIVRKYVRTGKVRLVFRPIAIIGPQSRTAAQFAGAAAAQNRLWPFIDRFYAAQQEENTGYVTTGFLRSVASGVAGLDVARALADRSTPAAAKPLDDSERTADRLGIDSTPSFLLGPTGGQLQPFEPQALSAGAFTPTLDKLVASA